MRGARLNRRYNHGFRQPGLHHLDHAGHSGGGLGVPERPVQPELTRDMGTYEAELAFVVGRRARRVAEADALQYVAGYTCFNDVSVRDYQMRTSQWTMGKVFDTHGPCGPVLVTRDAIPDPQALRISCSIGGEVLQNSSTAEMVFGVARIVAELSAVMTLEPGDIVATGTPAGVGTSRNPRRWIKPGERVRVEIEGVGILENPAVAR